MTSRGNGYTEIDVGVFNAGLITAYGVMIAKTDGDIIIGYTDTCNRRDAQEVENWADEYGYPVEWR